MHAYSLGTFVINLVYKMAWFFYFLCCDALSTRNCRVLELVHHHRDVLVFTLESFGLFLSF